MKMIEVKTAKLIGPALDWAVAMVEGAKAERPHDGQVSFGSVHLLCGSDKERGFHAPCYSPSTNWNQGGPLLTKYQLEFSIDEDTNRVGASLLAWRSHGKSHRTRWSKGPHHLTAACRAIVAAKLGYTVQVPAGLLAE